MILHSCHITHEILTLKLYLYFSLCKIIIGLRLREGKLEAETEVDDTDNKRD